ncbi:hypothetical protein vseg_013930 [Gypsophila vaccaria]
MNTFFTFPKPPTVTLTTAKATAHGDAGIPNTEITTLAKFKSRHNHIRVVQISPTANHPFRGGRLLLLDTPGNISSITFHRRLLTTTYFDVFATLPPLLPAGPTALLGLGGASIPTVVLPLYSDTLLHCWELDPAVVAVAREFFHLSKLERQYTTRLVVHIGDGLTARIKDGFAGIMVDLFMEGSLLRELEEPATWERLKGRLRKGGRVMVNVGGRCVEAEDSRRDGKAVMESCLKAMWEVFGDEGLHVLRLGDGDEEDSSIALTGGLPDLESWRLAMPRSLRGFVDMWTPYRG